MATETKRVRPLDEFFAAMDARAETATIERTRVDLFARIVEALDGPADDGQSKAVAKASGTNLAREVMTREQEELEGEAPSKEYARMIQEAASSTAAYGLRFAGNLFIYVVIATSLIAGVVTGVRYVGRVASESRAEAQQIERAREAFVKAGWRESEKVVRNKHDLNKPTTTEVSYLREIGPDDGRVLLKVTDASGAGDYSFEISGWTRTEALRSQIIAEIASVFPFTANPSLITVRPQGGKLDEGEARVIRPEPRANAGGQPIGRLQYGEGGYLTKRTGLNTVTGAAPKEGEPYIYVIGGGGQYWKTPQQRQRMLSAAFDRLKQAPHGGKGVRAIYIVYQEGDSSNVDSVLVEVGGNGALTEIPGASTQTYPPTNRPRTTPDILGEGGGTQTAPQKERTAQELKEENERLRKAWDELLKARDEALKKNQ